MIWPLAWDAARMDALLLLHPLATALGYDGPGDFALGEDGRLARRQDGARAPFLFAGLQILHPRLFADAPPGAFSLNLLYDRAIAAGRLFGVVHGGGWCHVGTPADIPRRRSVPAPTGRVERLRARHAWTSPRSTPSPPALPFVDALAAGLRLRLGDAPEALADARILLPTRRACRALTMAFVRQAEGRPLLLPRMTPLGDIDEDDLAFDRDRGAERCRRRRPAAGDPGAAPPAAAGARRWPACWARRVRAGAGSAAGGRAGAPVRPGAHRAARPGGPRPAGSGRARRPLADHPDLPAAARRALAGDARQRKAASIRPTGATGCCWPRQRPGGRRRRRRR